MYDEFLVWEKCLFSEPQITRISQISRMGFLFEVNALVLESRRDGMFIEVVNQQINAESINLRIHILPR